MPFGIGMAARHKPQYRAWTPAETLQLQELAGDMPFVYVAQQFNNWASRHGIPHRSVASLHKKLRALGGSCRCSGTWLQIGDVAQMLGKSRSTISLWCHNHPWIRYHKAGHNSSVNRDDLIRLARERPQLYAGTDRDNLILLLEDEELADSILERFPRRYWAKGRGKRVRWTDTGQVFETLKDAAAATNLDYSSIGKALRQGRPAAGLRFEWLD